MTIQGRLLGLVALAAGVALIYDWHPFLERALLIITFPVTIAKYSIDLADVRGMARLSIIVIKPPEPKQISTWGMLRSVVPLYKMDGADIKWFMSSTYK
jgi:hypothetical protein